MPRPSCRSHLTPESDRARHADHTYAGENPSIPIYELAHPERSRRRHGENATTSAVVSADGLTGDFGKDPTSSPLLISATLEDPDAGDAVFGNGDRITLRFDRPTNVSEDVLEFPDPLFMSYVDSLFEVSDPLGSLYTGSWLDASTFRIDVQNAWLPQPQINLTMCGVRQCTTRAWLHKENPLASADGSTPAAAKTEASALQLVGSLGTHARPRLLSAVGGDPDNADDVFSNGDTITFTFDMPTYIGQVGSQGDGDKYRQAAGGEGGGGTIYDADAIHALFEFDYYWPAESSGTPKRVRSGLCSSFATRKRQSSSAWYLENAYGHG